MAAIAPAWTDGTMTTAVRRLLNEPTARFYNDTEIVYWIDRATQAISGMALGLEQCVGYVALSTGKYEYAYSDFTSFTTPIKILGIIYMGAASVAAPAGNAKALQKIHPRMLNQVQDTTAGLPIYWCEFAEKIWVWPPPDSNANTKFIVPLYYRTLASTPTTLPDYYQDLVLFYVLSQAYEKAGKYEQANQYMSIFLNFMMFIRGDRVPMLADSQDMMRSPDNTQLV